MTTALERVTPDSGLVLAGSSGKAWAPTIWRTMDGRALERVRLRGLGKRRGVEGIARSATGVWLVLTNGPAGIHLHRSADGKDWERVTVPGSSGGEEPYRSTSGRRRTGWW